MNQNQYSSIRTGLSGYSNPLLLRIVVCFSILFCIARTTVHATTLIDDDFSGGDGDFTEILGGTWSVSSGVYELTSPATSAPNQKLSNISVHDTAITDSEWEITAEVSVVGTGSNWDGVSLVFDFQDDENYYHFAICEGDNYGHSGLFKVANNTPSQIANVATIISQNTTYTLKVERDGSSIVCYIDGTQVASGTDSSFSGGKVGFGTQFNSASFDDLLVISNSTIAVTGVSVSPSTLDLDVGETSDLTETVSPGNATDPSVSWSTNNASVATVNSSGLVTAVAAGSATITVTTADGSYTDTTSVTVTVPVSGVSVSPATLTLDEDETYDLTETVSPSNATDKSVAWSSSNTSVATVNSSGLVTAVSEGSAIITVTTNDGSFTDTTSVTVNPSTISVTGVSVTPATLTLEAGQSSDLTEAVSPSNATNKSVSWSTSNASVATVDSSGLVTAVAAGSVTITVTTTDGSYTDTTAVTVNASTGTITLIDDDFSSGAGDFTEILGGTWSVSSEKYVLSSPASASIQTVGNLSVHNTTITESEWTVTATVKVTGTGSNWDGASLVFNYQDSSNYYHFAVNEQDNWGHSGLYKVTSGSASQITNITDTISTNTDYTLKVERNGSSIVCYIDDVEVASGTDSSLTGGKVGFGSQDSGATFDDLLVTAPGTTVSVTGVSVSPATLTLVDGETADLTETISPSNATNKAVSWSTSNSSVATVNSSGLVTAVDPGSATITVTTNDGSFTDTTSVTVTLGAVSVTGVSVSPANLTLTEGQTADLTETVSPANATDKSVSWSTSNASVATVSSSGLVTAVSEGSATITATTTDGSFTDTTAVTVNAIPTGPIIDEDFSSGASNFTVISGGTWSVSSGKYTLTSPGTNGSGLLGNISVHNTSISESTWEVSVVGSVANNGAWDDFALIFNYQDSDNFYYFIVNEQNNEYTSGIFKVVDGEPYELADVTSYISAGTDYTLKVARSGSSIIAYLDGTLVASATDTTFTGGKVGVGGKNDPATFDDLLVIATNPVSVDGVSVSPSSVTITTGASTTLTKTITPSNASNHSVTWSSNNTGVATVNSSGVVTGVSVGSATVTATTVDGGFTDTAIVTVEVPANNVYYVDPTSGSMSNSGTSPGSAWSTLQAVFAAGKTFAAGSTIYLMDGNHGFPVITASNSSDVTITRYGTDEPIINRIKFDGAENWVLDSVEIYTSSEPPEAQILTHPVSPKSGNFLVRIDNSDYITLSNCYLYSIEDSSSWDDDDWNSKAWEGIDLANSPHTLIDGCTLRNVNFGIRINGSAPNSIVRSTLIENFCGDGIKANANNTLIENSTIINAYDTNGNHDDGIQCQGGNSNIVIRGVVVCSYTESGQPYKGDLQAIFAGTSGGANTGFLIENCVVSVDTWNGLAIYGAIDCQLINNTCIENPLTGATNNPWLGVLNGGGITCTGNLIRNNFVSRAVKNEGTGNTEDHNLVTTSYTSHFEDYANFDFHLKSSSSAIDSGSSTGAPSIDWEGDPRDANPDQGADEYYTGNVSVTGVSLFPSSLSLSVGEASDLTETISPSTATNKSVTWSTSNASVATVSSSGLVTGVASGSATITVTTVDGSHTDTTSVTVSSGTISVTGVGVSPSSVTLSIGQASDLTETVTPANATNKSVSWSTSNASVATVNGNGLVTAVSTGSATITVTTNDGGYTDTSSVTVSSGSGGPIVNEDFSSGASNFTTVSGGTWTVSGGRYVLSSPASGGTGLLGNIVVQDTSITETSWEVSVLGNVVDSASDWNDFALIFNYQDSSNFYYAIVNESNDVSTSGIFKVVSGTPIELVDIAAPINGGMDYVLKVVRDGDSITAYIDGVRVAAVSDSTFTGGKVGFGTKNDSAEFDNLLVIPSSFSDTVAPSVPTGLTASNIGSTSVDLDWNASTDNVGVVSYHLYTDGANPVNITTTSITLIGLSSETSYTFSVSALDAAGNESSESADLDVTTTVVLTPTAVPSFSPAGGFFTSSQSVTITTATSGATIRYTIDGSTPTSENGMVYSGAISISSTTTLRAIAYKGGLEDSNVVTANYTINTGGGAPFRPDATNTGLTNPSILTPYSGHYYAETDGETIENLHITGGRIAVFADNVTIRNCYFDGDDRAWDAAVDIAEGGNALIEDCEMVDYKNSGVRGSNFTARRLYIHDMGSDAFKGSFNYTIESCFVTDLGKNTNAHADGVQMTKGSGAIIRWNRFHMPSGDPVYAHTQVFQIVTTDGPIDDVLIEENWINGANFSVRLDDKDRGNGHPTNAIVRNNLFGRDYLYGLFDLFNANPPAIYGNVWEDTGQPIPANNQ